MGDHVAELECIARCVCCDLCRLGKVIEHLKADHKE
jgi:hypothetical protein